MKYSTEEIKEIKEKNREMVASISKIEGYNPDVETVKIESSSYRKDGVVLTILPVTEKRKVFRLLHPTGVADAIEEYPALPKELPFEEKKKALELLDAVIVTSYIYLSSEEFRDKAYVAKATACVTVTDLEEVPVNPVKKYNDMYALAVGKAETRALSHAGIGMQYFDKEEEKEEEGKVVDSIGLPDDFGIPAPTTAPVPSEPASEAGPVSEKPKRHRRTKAEIEADRLAEEARKAEAEAAKAEVNDEAVEEDTDIFNLNDEPTAEEGATLPLEEIWENEFGKEPDYDNYTTSLDMFKGRKYSDIIKEQPDVLIYVAKNPLPEEERKVVKHFIELDETLSKKVKRMIESPGTRADQKENLMKVMG